MERGQSHASHRQENSSPWQEPHKRDMGKKTGINHLVLRFLDDAPIVLSHCAVYPLSVLPSTKARPPKSSRDFASHATSDSSLNSLNSIPAGVYGTLVPHVWFDFAKC